MARRLVLVLTLLLAACGEPGLMPRAAVEDADEDAIYLAALQELYGNDPIVVQLETIIADTVDARLASTPRRGRPPAADPALVASYVARSATRRTLRANVFAGRSGAAVVPLAVIDSLLAPDMDDFWKGYHARFPGMRGLVRLSRAGFSADRTQALVLAHLGCGSLCGEGGLLLLERRDGRWAVVRTVVSIHN